MTNQCRCLKCRSERQTNTKPIITECPDKSSLVGRFTYAMLDIVTDMVEKDFRKEEIRELLIEDLDDTLNDHFIELERDWFEEGRQWVGFKSIANYVNTKEEVTNPRFTHDLAVLDSMSIGDILPIILISRFWMNY